MKKKIKSLQELKQVNLISQSKLKHLKGGGVIGAAKGKTKVK